MLFMSDRGGQPWSTPMGYRFHGKEGYDGDLWFSVRVDGKWQPPQVLPLGINSPDGEDEPVLLPDGSLIFQSWRDGWVHQGGPYFLAKPVDSLYWSIVKGLNGGITQFFAEKLRRYRRYATDGAYVTPDLKHFFVACGVEYTGAMDIYYSQWDERKQRWGPLKKHPISTEGDERSLFITPDGKTLFFASNSYPGKGGLDIFVADLQPDGTITNIRNLGAPFNTEADEYGFIISEDSTEAYFIRDGDIYYVNLRKIKIHTQRPINEHKQEDTLPLRDTLYEWFVYFEFDKSFLTDSAKEVLRHAFPYLQRADSVFIEGHTDTVGTSVYNDSLSYRRAVAVRDYLISLGMVPSRLVIRYFGERHPLAEPALSRRVRVWIRRR